MGVILYALAYSEMEIYELGSIFELERDLWQEVSELERMLELERTFNRKLVNDEV